MEKLFFNQIADIPEYNGKEVLFFLNEVHLLINFVNFFYSWILTFPITFNAFVLYQSGPLLLWLL